MTNNQLTKVLEKHGIKFELVADKVIAQDEYTINGVLHSDTIDLTGITRGKLYDWLGY